MKIVIDTNVLIAGLLKDSIIRSILMLNSEIKFFLPEFSLSEIKKYEDVLCSKAGYTKRQLNELLTILLSNIKLVSKKEIEKYKKKGKMIMKDIDVNDSSFIATCFAINGDGIWSFDKHFEKQNEVKIFNIQDIIRMLK